MSRLMVAEKSSVFRSSGTCSSISSMLSWNPMFSISSASSSTYLLFDAGAAIHRLDVDAVQVFAKVAQVVGNLQAQLSRRSENQGQRQTSSHFS